MNSRLTEADLDRAIDDKLPTLRYRHGANIVELRTRRPIVMVDDGAPDTMPAERWPSNEREFALSGPPVVAPSPRERRLDDVNAGVWWWSVGTLAAVVAIIVIVAAAGAA